MKTIELSKAMKSLSEYAAQLGEETIVVTENRKPIAALVTLRGIDRESLSLGSNPEFLKMIQRARREFQRGRSLSMAEMRQELKKSRRKSNKKSHNLG